MALSDNLHQLGTRSRHATSRTARERAYPQRRATDAGRARITDWRADVEWEDTLPGGNVAHRSSAAAERPASGREAMCERTDSWWLWLVAGVAWIVVSLSALQFDAASATTVSVLAGLHVRARRG